MPETQVTVFYMDIQNFGKDFDRYFEEARSRLRFVRGLPGDYYLAENGMVSVGYFNDKVGRAVTEDFDLVVLSVGMSPAGSNPLVGERLGLGLSRHGFLRRPGEAGGSGIAIAGSAEGPMDVPESISHAKRAALEMADYLKDKG
jgi:heterodisulfide reductase subunit A